MDNLLSIIIGGTLILNVTLATSIIKKDRIGLWFGLMIYCIAFWNFCLLLFDFLLPYEYTVPALNQLYFWGKITLIAPIIIPALYFHFAVEYTRSKKLNHKKILLIFLPTLILLLFIPTKWNYGYYEFVNGRAFAKGEYLALYIPFTLYFVSYLTAAFMILWRGMKNLSTTNATQIRYIVLGSVFAAAVGITTNSILPLLNMSFVSIVGAPASIVFSLSVAYAILKHRFMDIRVVINKSIVYAVLAAVFAGLTAFFALLLGNEFSDTLSTNILLSAAIVAVVIALAFPPLYKIVQLLVDKVIARPNARYPHVLKVSEYTLARCETVYGLAIESRKLIHDSLHADSTLFALNTFQHLFESSTHNRSLTRAQTNALVNFFRDFDETLMKDEVDRTVAKHPYAETLLRDIDKFMASRRIEAIVPLNAGPLLYGFLVLHEKKQGLYSEEDTRFLADFRERLNKRFCEIVADEQATKRMEAFVQQIK